MIFTKTRTLMVPLAELERNPVQSEDRITDTAVRTLRDNVLESKFIAPPIVQRRGDRYTVLDGHRRFAVATDLGLPAIECVEVLDRRPAELWFVWLNGGIRNVKGANWFFVWARSKEPDRTLEALPRLQRQHIEQMVRIFGQARAVEIGRTGNYAPSIWQFVDTLVKALQRLHLVDPTAAQQRRMGEWVLAHRQTNAIRQELQNVTPRPSVIRRFYTCIQEDRPFRDVTAKGRRGRRARQPRTKEGVA